MQESNNPNTVIENQAEVPSLIIDKSGRVIALNSPAKKIIQGITAQSNFFEFFDEQKLLSLQKIFIDARKYDITSKDIIEFQSETGLCNYEISIAPLKSENNIYYLVALYKVGEKRKDTETQKIWIATSELEKITDDKRILSVVNKIKVTYPFTFIEKAKIQKEINELENYFWIKDVNGKYIVVNDAYAESLGFKAAQIENKKEEDFLPKFLIPIYQTIDKLIFETTNNIIFEGMAAPAMLGGKRELKIVELPICDLDNEVIAIIGISIKSDSVPSSNKGINPAVYKSLPVPVFVINSEGNIAGYSNEFVRLMSLNERIDYTNQDLSKILEKQFVVLLSERLKDFSANQYQFIYNFIEKASVQVEVNLTHLYNPDNSYVGSQIILLQKNGLQAVQDSKAELYDLLSENTAEAMFIYDLDNLKFLEVNEAALKLYGYKRSDFLNMDLTDLYAPEDIQTLISASDKSAGANLIGPWRHKKSDGSSIFVEITRKSVNYIGKKAHLNLLKNVTNNAVEKMEIQILKASYENTNDLIIITDKEGFISESNDNISKNLGYSKKDLENKPLISLVIDDDRAKVNKNIFHSGIMKTTSVEVNFKRPSLGNQKATIIATPIKDINGEINSFVLVIKLPEEKGNIKDVKHAQGEALEKVDPPFLSNMFHEILTPINVILGFTQEIGESLEHPSAEQKEALDIINENQKLLLQIMDNAVEYSTLNEKVVRFKPEEIRFIEILDELKETTRKTAESKKVELNYGRISSSLTLESDKQKLLSLLSLLIKFSIQITKENGIYLSAYSFDENNFVVAIKDTKAEISQYLLKGYTDVFSDEETVIRRNYGFSRFSIRLANKLIELLSVKREIIKKDDKVVEYAFVFPNKFVVADKEKMAVEIAVETPVQKPKPEPASPVTTPPVPPPQQPKPVKGVDLSQLSCLYFEDQVDSQILFKTQMKDLKSIEFAPSFETALPLLKTKRFDFIVMDMNLQGEYNGLDSLRIIQKMPTYKDIPIIASTAYVQSGARENFKAAGFTDFVSKPLLRDKLIEALKNIFPGIIIPPKQ
jgi:PAS domain S-box-containing protein